MQCQEEISGVGGVRQCWNTPNFVFESNGRFEFYCTWHAPTKIHRLTLIYPKRMPECAILYCAEIERAWYLESGRELPFSVIKSEIAAVEARKTRNEAIKQCKADNAKRLAAQAEQQEKLF